MLYKVDDGLSESDVSTVIYDPLSQATNRDNPLAFNDEVIMQEDETKTIDLNNFDQDNNMKVSHGKKQHIIVKII